MPRCTCVVRGRREWTVGCCLLDVCGLWLCFPPISVFGVVRMPAGPTVNAPYRSATPQATAAAVKPLRGCRMDEVCTRKGKRGKTSIQPAVERARSPLACVQSGVRSHCKGCFSTRRGCRLCSAAAIHLSGVELPAALPRLTSPLAKWHYQVPPCGST